MPLPRAPAAPPSRRRDVDGLRIFAWSRPAAPTLGESLPLPFARGAGARRSH